MTKEAERVIVFALRACAHASAALELGLLGKQHDADRRLTKAASDMNAAKTTAGNAHSLAMGARTPLWDAPLPEEGEDGA